MTEPITVWAVKEFCVLSGLCRDKVFELARPERSTARALCKWLGLVDSDRRWVAESGSVWR
jgi:hypothetical protein